MEPLKEMFNRKYFEILAKEFQKAHKQFDADTFLKKVTDDLDVLELNQRLRKTTLILKQHLPANYLKALTILKKVIPNLKPGYTNLVFPDFVGMYGQENLDTSLDALRYFTCYGSSEFAIRVFLKKDFDYTIKLMYTWALDQNYHVRRLASEGSRPRLPWSFKLDKVVENPLLTLPIVEALKSDPELYVRKSVANHLNDVSKEHPEFVLDLVEKWKGKSPHTDWILRHASRTLLKQGHIKVLSHFGIKHNASIITSEFKILNKKIKVGDSLDFNFSLINNGLKSVKVRIEYALYFRNTSGSLSKKVFKISERDILKAQTLSFKRKHSFKIITTRKYNAGIHKLAMVISGKEGKAIEFILDP